MPLFILTVPNLNRMTVNVLNNEKLQVDFKPLFECIHIYTSLDSLNELQKSYQADRKVQYICSILMPSSFTNHHFRLNQISFFQTHFPSPHYLP